MKSMVSIPDVAQRTDIESTGFDDRAVTVSIIIVTWNSIDEIGGCLYSIQRECGGISVEIIVIDNDSKDGTADLVEAGFPEVTLIRNETNRGFGAACNQGMEVAEGAYLLLLNPDTVILDDVVDRSIAWMEQHEDVAVLGCQVMDGPDSIQRTCFRFPSPWLTLLWVTGLAGFYPHHERWGRAAYGAWDRRDGRDVDVVSGMYLCVRRKAMTEVGMMDEDYFVFAEEADWCHRFWAKGWRCRYEPLGRILHVDGGNKSTDQARLKMFVEKQKNILLFQRKNFGAMSYWSSRSFFAMGMFIRSLVFRLRGKSADATFSARAAWRAFLFHAFGIGVRD